MAGAVQWSIGDVYAGLVAACLEVGDRVFGAGDRVFLPQLDARAALEMVASISRVAISSTNNLSRFMARTKCHPEVTCDGAR
jgi:hypothetical protein